MIEIIETWGQFVYWFPKCAATGMIVIAALLLWIAMLQCRRQVFVVSSTISRVSTHFSAYGIYTPNGWLTATDKVGNCPGSLSLKLREIWLTQGPSAHDWVVAEIPPDAGPPAQEAIVLRYNPKPPGLGEITNVAPSEIRRCPIDANWR